MTEKIGFTHIAPVDASATVPPEGHLLYAEDTDKLYKSDGTTKTELSSGGGSYSDEQAQDAVGAMVDTTLVYTDATPLLSRAALTGDVTASAGSNATTIANDAVTDAKLRNSAALTVIGRSANSSGDPADIAGATVGHVLQVVSGPTLGFASHRRPSWDNPPATSHSYDDEFDSTTKDAKWTLYGNAGTGCTGTAVLGSIDYTASLAAPIYDLTTVPGSLALQSDSSSIGKFGLQQTYSASTDSTFFIKISGHRTNVSVNIEGNVTLKLDNTGDANEWINIGWTHSSAGQGVIATVNNNGALTTTLTTTLAETTNGAAVYIALWKKNNVYHWGYAGTGSTSFTYGGSMTKTGVTTLDRINIEMVTANETPSIIETVDFFRYKASLDYGLVNP
jgi:hypothetical protein